MNYKKTLESVKKALETERNKTIKNRLTLIKVALQQIIKEVDNI